MLPVREPRAILASILSNDNLYQLKSTSILFLPKHLCFQLENSLEKLFLILHRSICYITMTASVRVAYMCHNSTGP